MSQTVSTPTALTQNTQETGRCPNWCTLPAGRSYRDDLIARAVTAGAGR